MNGLTPLIPFVGIDRQYANLRKEILDRTDKVLTSGCVLDGGWTAKFERVIGQRLNREFAISVNSCSTALLIAHLFYGGNYKHDTALTTAVSFVATANAAYLAGLKVNFVDVDDAGLMDLNQIDLGNFNKPLITYVNLFGNVIDYHKLQLITDFFNSNIPIIEDAAQSFGASYKGIPSGKLGSASCLSFDPTKNFPNYGSGGMLLTDNYDLAEFASDYRNNGKLNDHRFAGTNVKMSEVDCAQMLVKLKYFDGWQTRRTEIADFYTDRLSNYVVCPTHSEDVVHAWHKYAIKVDAQNEFIFKMNRAGIETKTHYAVPVPNYALFDDRDMFVNAEAHSRSTVSLPIYPEMTDGEVETVVENVIDIINSNDSMRSSHLANAIQNLV